MVGGTAYVAGKAGAVPLPDATPPMESADGKMDQVAKLKQLLDMQALHPGRVRRPEGPYPREDVAEASAQSLSRRFRQRGSNQRAPSATAELAEPRAT